MIFGVPVLFRIIRRAKREKYFARRSEVGGPSENVTYFIISDLFQDEV